MMKETEEYLGYDIKSLLDTMLHLKCPKCKGIIFEFFLSEKQFLVPVCYQCREILTIEELMRLNEMNVRKPRR